MFALLTYLYADNVAPDQTAYHAQADTELHWPHSIKVVRDLCPTSSAENRYPADLHEIVHTCSLTPLPSGSLFIFSKEYSVT